MTPSKGLLRSSIVWIAAATASETQETDKAPVLVLKRIREAILDEVFQPGDRLRHGSF
jgi:hypothetical protein